MLRSFVGTSKREKQYQAHQAFGDRRDGVVSARTYFYTNEAKCDSHMETFLRCIEASGGASLFAACPPARPSLGRPVACGHMGGWEAKTGALIQGFLSVWAALTVVRINWGDMGEPQTRLKSRWGHPASSTWLPPSPFLGTRCPVWTFGKALSWLAAPSYGRGKTLVTHGTWVCPGLRHSGSWCRPSLVRIPPHTAWRQEHLPGEAS